MIPTKPKVRWATSTSTFPAGSNPWSGQPNTIAPVNDYFQPQSDVVAEWVNYILKDVTGAANNNFNAIVGAAVNNWFITASASIPTSAFSPNGVYYNANTQPNANAWFIAGNLTSLSGNYVDYSTDNGRTWTSLSYSASATDGLFGVATNGGSIGGSLKLVCGQWDNTHGANTRGVAVYDGSWHQITGSVFSYSSRIFVPLVTYFQGVFGAFGAADISAAVAAWSSSPASSWTACTLPSLWSTSGFNGSTPSLLSAQSASTLVIVCATSPGSFIDNHDDILISSDGKTFTGYARFWSSYTNAPRGLAYDSVNGLFVAFMADESVWTSPTAASGTWTQLAANPPGAPTYNASSSVRNMSNALACCGGVWLVSTAVGHFYSTDQGATWSITTTTPMASASLAAGPGGFLAFAQNVSSGNGVAVGTVFG